QVKLHADIPSSLTICVYDSTTELPLKNSTVEVLEIKNKIQTDSNGNAILPEILPGKYKIKISMIGYKTKIDEIEIGIGENKKIDVKLDLAMLITGKKILITQRKTEIIKKDEITVQTIKTGTLTQTAGGLEDAYKVIQLMPGVTAAGDFSGEMYVRGGNSYENIVLIDRIFMANPFHLGGFTSIINSDIIEKVDFYAGGMPAEFGQALSSAIDITTRDGNNEEMKGSVDISLLTTKLNLDGPIKNYNGNWIISARRSYFDLLIKDKNTQVPNYGDYFEKFTFTPNTQNKLTLVFFQTKDNMHIKLDKKDIKSKYDAKEFLYVDFQNINSLDWKYIANQNFSIQSTISDNREKVDSQIIAEIYPEKFRYDYSTYSFRQDYTYIHTKSNEIKAGFYISNTDIDFKSQYRLPKNIAQGGKQDINNSSIDYFYLSANEKSSPKYEGYFLQNTLKFFDTALTIRYGGITERFSIVHDRVISPRINLGYKLNDNYLLKLAWGHYYQFPINLISTNKDSGNPNLKPERADHYIVGTEHLFNANTMSRVEIYYKDYINLITKENSDIKYSNNGKGNSKGIDFFLQRKETEKLNGWISYSYSMSKRKLDEAIGWIYPQQDQPHTVSVVANYKASPKWTISATLHLNSGRPYTPIIGRNYDSASSTWKPIEGSINSARLPFNHRLDLKFSRHFYASTYTNTFYFEFLNAYNAQNVYDYKWNEDYSKKTTIYSFPIIPFMGFEIKF
ncbi:TonB-dependent receptor, partial [Candidatus Desantisbacteria bacterium]|nr:TonB-dependent receptor [Candidatus Desantisbacteria bacterium]